MTYQYTFSLFGIKAVIAAPSLEKARFKLIERWVKYIDPDSRSYPIVPAIFLHSSNDPRVKDSEIDARLLPIVSELSSETPKNTADIIEFKRKDS